MKKAYVIIIAVLVLLGIYGVSNSRKSTVVQGNSQVQEVQEQSSVQSDHSGSEKTSDENASALSDDSASSAGNENADSTETEVSSNPIDIPANEEKALSIEAISQSVITISEAEIYSMDGQLSEEGQVDSYSIHTDNSGIYRVYINNLMSDTRVYIEICDGDQAINWAYCSNKEGLTVELEADKTYDITVEQYKGNSAYSLFAAMAKPVVDVSGYTSIEDKTEFDDQENIYRFTAPNDGKYRFDLMNMMEGLQLYIEVRNSLNEIMNSGYCTNREGITASLSAGEEYSIKITQYRDLGEYRLSIGLAKPSADVTGFTVVNDSIEYVDQENIYHFTAPNDGKYRFDLMNMMEGLQLYIEVRDSLNEIVNSGYCTNREGITAGLSAGEAYTIKIEQYRNLGTYSLSTGMAKPSVDITGYTTVNDSIEFVNQVNIYQLTASTSGEYIFSFSNMQDNMRAYICVRNSLQELISDQYCGNGDSMKANLSAGETYSVQVEQYDKKGAYSLGIN